VAEARRLVAAHKNRKQVFAIMFNQRADPRHRWIRDAIAAGTIGSLQRVNLVMTEWFRTNAYYRSAGWRGTWEGEGGGILMNQYAHHLDLLQWMCGMPKRVRAFCGIGKRHPIEVEDEVTAYFEYKNGATGVFVGSTGEAPGTNRFEIAGDLGRIVLEGGKVILTRNAVSAARFLKTSREPMAKPAARQTTIRSPRTAELHQALTQNFVDAILAGKPLIAPAEEGLRSLELANAMIYSSFTGNTEELPLNTGAYQSFLHKCLRTH
jgi:predicted dehydrogenase